nr:hypothetical protein [Tanacetum cinerariifolium]
MFEKIDKTLKHREQLRRLKEYEVMSIVMDDMGIGSKNGQMHQVKRDENKAKTVYEVLCRWRLGEWEDDTSSMYCSSSRNSVRGGGWTNGRKTRHHGTVEVREIQYEEPSYNQNYDDNYYPHESLSYPCCDYCGGSHETFQCQPDNHNIDFSSSDQIQTPQYPDVHENPLTNDEIEAFMKANDDKINNLETEFDHFQKQSSEEQKQNKEKTMLDLVKICHHKQFLCIHDDVDDLMESALESKLLSINSINSQRLDKKEQKVKIVEEQPAERRNHAEKSLQNFRVIHKSSISLKDTSQISSIHAVAPILSTKEPEDSLSMGYEHLSIIPETKSDEVTKSNAKNLLSIPSECEVTLEDKRECDELICENSSTIDVCDNHSEILLDSNNDDLSSDDESFEDIEYADASVPDPAIVSVEGENVVQQEEEEVDLEDISQVQDVVLRKKLFSITRLIFNIESLNDNSTPDRVLNSFESDNSFWIIFYPNLKLFAIIRKRREVVTLLMLITFFPNMIRFALRLSPVRRG